MIRRAFWTLLAFAVCAGAKAQTSVPVRGNVAVRGVPEIPLSLAREVDRYNEYRTAHFAAWHPDRVEMLVITRFGDAAQVHRVAEPGGRRSQLTFFSEPVLDVSSWTSDAGRELFTFQMDAGGDEFYQIYSFDLQTRRSALLTDGKKRNGGGVYSDQAGLLAYPRVDSDSQGAFTEFRVVDPRDPSTDRLVTKQPGGGWQPTDWSPDGKRFLALEYRSINDARVWEVELESGETRLVAPTGNADGEATIAHGDGKYAVGDVVYFTSDAESEFHQLYRVTDGRREKLTDGDWDIEDVALSRDGKWIAYTTNEAGRSVLRILDAATGEHIATPEIPLGVISGLRWHNDGRHLAFTLSSASIPGDVFVLERGGGLERWTFSESSVDTSQFSEPELVEWTSFDGRKISGFLYRPPARFEGKRPVILNIHGGPESQSRPKYQGETNYFLNEMGIAVLYPNVRGSQGYGKSFLKLDNGLLREGTHKDIEALIDWVNSRDDLDAGKIMVRGGSYGGYMTLSAAYRFSDRIACAVDLVGISNLRTFLENTKGYRRDLRRAEYGDERIPELRRWMDETSALHNVDKIRKPLLVLQGANDPRVPKSESDQIVSALERTKTPVWYVVFEDEGHGFRKKPNADFAFYCTVLFAKTYLE